MTAARMSRRNRDQTAPLQHEKVSCRGGGTLKIKDAGYQRRHRTTQGEPRREKAPGAAGTIPGRAGFRDGAALGSEVHAGAAAPRPSRHSGRVSSPESADESFDV